MIRLGLPGGCHTRSNTNPTNHRATARQNPNDGRWSRGRPGARTVVAGTAAEQHRDENVVGERDGRCAPRLRPAGTPDRPGRSPVIRPSSKRQPPGPAVDPSTAPATRPSPAAAVHATAAGRPDRTGPAGDGRRRHHHSPGGRSRESKFHATGRSRLRKGAVARNPISNIADFSLFPDPRTSAGYSTDATRPPDLGNCQIAPTPDQRPQRAATEITDFRRDCIHRLRSGS